MKQVQIPLPRRGRPPLPAGERKSEQLAFVMTTELKQAIESRAREQGVDAAVVIRAAVIEYLRDPEEDQSQ